MEKSNLIYTGVFSVMVLLVVFLLYRRHNLPPVVIKKVVSGNVETTLNTATGANTMAHVINTVVNTPNPRTGANMPGSPVIIPPPPVPFVKYSTYTAPMIQMLFPNGDKDRLLQEYASAPDSKETFIDAIKVMWNQGENNRKNLPANIVNNWIQSHIDIENFLVRTNNLTAGVNDAFIVALNKLMGAYMTNFVTVVKTRAAQNAANDATTMGYVNSVIKLGTSILPLFL